MTVTDVVAIAVFSEPKASDDRTAHSISADSSIQLERALPLSSVNLQVEMNGFSLAVTINRPRLCPNVSWAANNATTFNSIFPKGFGIFVTNNNTIYGTEVEMGHIHAWKENGTGFMEIDFTPYTVRDVFVSTTGNIYANAENKSQVYQWTPGGSTRVGVVMNVTALCFGLFIDINQNLLCSMADEHRVSSVSLSSPSITPTVVAGTGTAGSASNMLSCPNGIFVADNFDLYVADCNNSRIQLFVGGSVNATTVAGSGTTGTISLNYPTDVALDGNDYLFIVDGGNNRIVADGLYGYRCIAACSGSWGGGPDRLGTPQSLAFDNLGNIYVAESGMQRIQKFLIIENSCGECNQCFTCFRWKRSRPSIELRVVFICFHARRYSTIIRLMNWILLREYEVQFHRLKY